MSYLIAIASQASSLAKLRSTVFGEDWLPADDPKSQGFVERLYSEFAPAAQPQLISTKQQTQQKQSDLDKIKEL